VESKNRTHAVGMGNKTTTNTDKTPTDMCKAR